MRNRISRTVAGLLSLALSTSAAAIAADPSPTPTPRPKTTRKLGGGSFGLPPGPTPTPGGTGAGSLADVARKAQETPVARESGRPKGIVITNESLRKGEPAPGAGSVTITGSATSKPKVSMPGTPTPAVPAALSEYRDASGRTEADWRQKASEARERIDQVAKDRETAQAEVRRLENDFYAWSDGNCRERVIRPAWDQAKERLKLLEAEAEKANAALADLEEEARKSATPPGWLR